MTRQCANPDCSRLFKAKRSDAKTCSDSCRQALSRRRRDPEIGSAERRQRQRLGLDKKYEYRQRGQAREDLQRLGLVPTSWDGGEPSSFSVPRDPLLWHRRTSPRSSRRPPTLDTLLAIGLTRYTRSYVEFEHPESDTPKVIADRALVCSTTGFEFGLSLAKVAEKTERIETALGAGRYRACVERFAERVRKLKPTERAELRALFLESLEPSIRLRLLGLSYFAREDTKRNLLAAIAWYRQKGDTMLEIPTDEALARDAQWLAETAEAFTATAARLAATAERVRVRFPLNREVEEAVEALLSQLSVTEHT